MTMQSVGSRSITVKKATFKKRSKDEPIPDFIKKSPRWKKIESLNKDLDSVSLNFLNYTDYLIKVKREIKREEMRAEQEYSESNSPSPSRRTSNIL